MVRVRVGGVVFRYFRGSITKRWTSIPTSCSGIFYEKGDAILLKCVYIFNLWETVGGITDEIP